ncbi:MAG TPA: tetratricopeptide repeat protein [Bacteroidales bacterium]|nr:tetratricopeptide repeat protein [Bacteroidales bacterium]
MDRLKVQFLIILFCFLAAGLSGQKPPVYSTDDEDFKRAMELYSKEKYASALTLYDDFVSNSGGMISNEVTEAQFLAAMSSIRLYNSDAEYRMNRFVSEHPESPLKNIAWLELADHFYQSKNYRRAIWYYEMVDRLELQDELLPEYYFKAGYSQFMNGDKKRAMLYFADIMDIDTEYTPPAIYYFSHIAYENEMYRTALDGFIRLKKDESFGSVVSFYIVQLMYILKDYDGIIENGPSLLEVAGEERASELYRIIGDAYFQKENYSEAVTYLEEHVKRAQRTGREGSYQLAFCYYKAGEYERSIPLFQEVCRTRDEISQNAYYLLGDCFLRQGEKKLAQSAFSSASKMDFDNRIKEEALFNFAKLTYETTYSPFGEVIRAFQEYIEQYPASDHLQEAYDYLVSAYMKVKNYNAAIQSLDRIAVKDERLERAYQRVAFYRGLELYRNLGMAAAIDMFDKSLKYGKYDRKIRARANYWKGESWHRLNETEEALASYEEFMGIPGASELEEFSMVGYNIGYIHFNLGEYNEALRWFRSYETNEGEKNEQIITDVHNRMADCYYISTDYDQAIEYYNKVIGKGGKGADYAMFQKGFALGLKHDQRAKVQVISQLLTGYPRSSLVPNALFERGRAYVSLNDSEHGETDFKVILSDHTNSVFVPRAMVQLGLLYYNRGDNENALRQYKQVIEKYPATPEARNAFTGLKNVYVEVNDVESYFAYVRGLDGYGDITSSERDSLLYLSGENLYIAGNCDRAVAVLKSYLNEFGQGSFRLNANFYLAECLNASGRQIEALSNYLEVVSISNNPFLEQSYISISDIFYSREIYDSAYYFYVGLERVAEMAENVLTAKVGQMRSAYYMGDPDLTLVASGKVLASERITEELAREATFMAAKSNYAMDNFNEALSDFRRVAAEVTTSEGAESKFRVADILFKNGKVDEAEKIVYEFIDQSTPHQYWMARMFILLADISIARDDDFQARATLQSLADYYQVEDDGILDEVRAKIDELGVKEGVINDTIRFSTDRNRLNR